MYSSFGWQLELVGDLIDFCDYWKRSEILEGELVVRPRSDRCLNVWLELEVDFISDLELPPGSFLVRLCLHVLTRSI